MTALAIGASVTAIVRDGGIVAVSSNGGLASAVVTTTEGASFTVSLGPAPERRILGPYAEGASVVLSNISCNAFDYDAETRSGTPFDPASVAITGGTIGGVAVAQLAPIYGRTVAFFGDSRTNQAFNGSATLGSPFMNHGLVHWLRYLTEQRIATDATLNFGVSGDTTAQMLARAPSAVTACRAAGVSIVVLFGGTNDPGAGITAATSIANLQAIVGLFRAAGIVVILVAESARADGQYTTQIEYIHQACKELSTAGVFVADCWADYADPSTGQAKTNYTYDAIVHPSPQGAFYIAQAIAPILNQLLPANPILCATNTDAWSASLPHGNMLPNGMWQGTAGTLNGGANSGVASSVSIASPAGVTVTPTKALDSNGYTAQQVAWAAQTPTAAGVSYIRLEMDASAGAVSSLVAGDQVQLAARVECDQLTGVYSVEAYFLDIGSGNGPVDGYGYSATAGAVPLLSLASGWKGVMRTPSFVVPANPLPTGLRMRLRIGLYNSLATSGTVRFSRVALRKTT